LGGAKALEYKITRAAARADEPMALATDKGLRAWRAGVVVNALTGRAVVDDASGALLQLDLTETFTTKRDGDDLVGSATHDLAGSVEVHGVLTDVSSTAAVTAPPSEDLALRQRTVPEQRELLAGLPSTRMPPPAPPKPAARAAAPTPAPRTKTP
jgi:hypothetical protein